VIAVVSPEQIQRIAADDVETILYATGLGRHLTGREIGEVADRIVATVTATALGALAA
jgi:hypothetical protein